MGITRSTSGVVGNIGSHLNKGKDTGEHNILAYGARGNDSIDDSQAFLDAIIAIGTQGGYIYCPPGKYIINTTLDITVPIKIAQGAVLVAKDHILTISDYIEAGKYTIFEYSGTGTISFIGNTKLKEVYPQWWGAVGDDINDDTTAIQSAINAATDSIGRVYLVAGTYLSTGLYIPSYVTIHGSQRRKTVIKASGIGEILTGTAQSGTLSTIVLAIGESAVDHTNKGNLIYIVSGTGAGQCRFIKEYTGSTRTVDVSSNWSTAPDVTSVYSIRRALIQSDYVNSRRWEIGIQYLEINATGFLCAVNFADITRGYIRDCYISGSNTIIGINLRHQAYGNDISNNYIYSMKKGIFFSNGVNANDEPNSNYLNNNWINLCKVAIEWDVGYSGVQNAVYGGYLSTNNGGVLIGGYAQKISNIGMEGSGGSTVPITTTGATTTYTTTSVIDGTAIDLSTVEEGWVAQASTGQIAIVLEVNDAADTVIIDSWYPSQPSNGIACSFIKSVGLILKSSLNSILGYYVGGGYYSGYHYILDPGYNNLVMGAYQYNLYLTALECIILMPAMNVGIGTTTPSAKLAINGGLHVGGDSNPGDNNLLVDGNVKTNSINAIDGNGLALYEDGGAGIFIKDGGFVGIGTTVPTSNVHITSVQNNTGPTLTLELLDPGTSISVDNLIGAIDFQGNDGQGFGVRARILGICEGASGETGLAFYTAIAGFGASTEKVRITNAGNVGINTTTPLAKLAINGGLAVGEDADPGDNNLKVVGNAEIDGALNHDGTTVGLYGTTPVVQGAALTAQLTSITHTAPGTPDYALQDLVQNTGFGFVTKDEGNTLLAVIANLQARVAQLESRLGSVSGVGLFS